jgi:hypothetical protein
VKQEKIGRQRSKFVCLTACTLFFVTRSFAQTVPMTPYEIKTSRGTYSGVLVGGNPFGPTNPVTIDAVMIPLIVQIIKKDGTLVTYDPTAADDCDNNISVAYSFEHSPLVVASDLWFNGVNVGKAQYIDGFMRAEFWNALGHSRSSYKNDLNWSFTSPVVLPVVLNSQNTIFQNTGCNEEAIVSADVFDPIMEGFISLLQSEGVISTKKFVYFLTSHVVTSGTNPPTTTGLSPGRHYATGSPVQTWARGSGGLVTASHEIGEWMNDPLLTNQTPSWGNEGEFKGGPCSIAFEVGDPLNGIGVPIKLSGVKYNVQELAFFSWFFNPEGFFSYGAGGKFSSNGTFKGPSKTCPTGGTN